MCNNAPHDMARAQPGAGASMAPATPFDTANVNPMSTAVRARLMPTSSPHRTGERERRSRRPSTSVASSGASTATSNACGRAGKWPLEKLHSSVKMGTPQERQRGSAADRRDRRGRPCCVPRRPSHNRSVTHGRPQGSPLRNFVQLSRRKLLKNASEALPQTDEPRRGRPVASRADRTKAIRRRARARTSLAPTIHQRSVVRPRCRPRQQHHLG